MPTIAGASRFLGASTLANTRGLAAQSPTVLGENGATSLLDVGRRLSSGNGIGISSSARALNNRFLNNTANINALLSLAIGPSATVEGAAQQIRALRARLPDSQLARSLRSDDGGVSSAKTGQAVDTKV